MLPSGVSAKEPGSTVVKRAWAHMQTWHNPKIAAAARALDDTRHADPAAAAAWADRTGDRMEIAQAGSRLAGPSAGH